MKNNTDKIIRKFMDNENNIYTIKRKINNHYYLTIKEKGKDYALIFSGSKKEILIKLQDIHKNTNFKSIE